MYKLIEYLKNGTYRVIEAFTKETDALIQLHMTNLALDEAQQRAHNTHRRFYRPQLAVINY